MFRTLALCAAAAAFVPAAAPAAMPVPATTYLKKAGAGDLFEIKSSKLVMASTNPKIQDFAKMMVADHTQSTADVKAAAMTAGLTPRPPMLSAAQATMIAELTKAKGAARDTLYISQQKTAHEEALTLQQDFATNGTSPPLKTAAAKIVPVVKTHIQLLAAM